MGTLPDRIILLWHTLALGSTLSFLYWGMFGSGFEIDFICHLTFITQEFVAIYYVCTLIYDMKNLMSNKVKMQRYDNFIYTYLQILCPVTCLTIVAYWSVRFKDINLLLNPDVQGDPIIVPLYNHGINAVLCIAELIIFQQKICKEFYWKFSFLIISVIVYILIQIIFHFSTGRYVYPFLKAFTFSQICAFYFSLTIFLIIMERLSTFLIAVTEAVPVKELDNMNPPKHASPTVVYKKDKDAPVLKKDD